jgi:hypothetical protein
MRVVAQSLSPETTTLDKVCGYPLPNSSLFFYQVASVYTLKYESEKDVAV